jgi:hypothetical protein
MTFRMATIAAALVLLASPASSDAAQRTFVASYGVDANPCSVTQPCRTFAAAVALTSANGEVIVLDSAGYGPVTISQPVAIIASPGAYAGITVFSGDGITVGGTFGPVVLRGLTINGQGGNRGIVVTYGVVHVESCTVSNMAQSGIAFVGDARGFVIDSIVRSSGTGLLLNYPGTYPPLPDGHLQVQVSDSHFSWNMLGVETKGGSLAATRVTVEKNMQHGVALTGSPNSPLGASFTDSVLSWNGDAGVSVSATAGLAPYGTDLQVLRSTIAHNGSWGIDLHANDRGARAIVTDSTVTANGQGGLLASGLYATAVVTRSTLAANYGPDLSQADSAVLRTSENNTLTGRGAADVVGTLTPNPLR